MTYRTETNIFLIQNLRDLQCDYHTYKIRGLLSDSEEFYKNTQHLLDRLSRRQGAQSPCHFFRKGEGCFIAQPDGYTLLPETFKLIRTQVRIEKQPGPASLRFDSRDPLDQALIQRFLQFSLQNPLHNNPALWQPRAGAQFFNKTPDRGFSSQAGYVDLYKGFKFRVVPINGTIGICVDTANKYVAREPLPTEIGRNEFNRNFKGLNCVYEYGKDWFEIKVDGLNDLPANEVIMPDGETNLFDLVHRTAGRNKSSLVLALPASCSVLSYKNSRGETRNAPSGLCRPTYTTDHPEIAKLHRKTIKQPGQRRDEIVYVVERNLRGLNFGDIPIMLSNQPMQVPLSQAAIPALQFGHGRVLTTDQNLGNNSVSFSMFPSKKKELMYSEEAGIYVSKPLDRQYFILPKSVHETYGPEFLSDLSIAVNTLMTNSGISAKYDPIIIPYNDSVKKNVYNMAQSIFNAVDRYNPKDGFGVVMIPKIHSRSMREDELGNLLMRKMRDRDVHVSIIHTTMPSQGYELGGHQAGKSSWKMVGDRKQRGAIFGYIRGVALNKVVLLNSYWPFILKSELNADLTVGIDVKNKVAGFTFIYKTGADFRFFSSESTENEQLSQAHLRSKMSEFLNNERSTLSKNKVKIIVIHRQGRLFPPEIKGIKEGLEIAARNGHIPKDYACTFVEIQKTSMVPFRFFSIKNIPNSQTEKVMNPVVGTYYCLSPEEAFLCNTGYPYNHLGTVKPIHVVKIEGPMLLNSILQDTFSLANLTWTKVDDCSRDPLTIKMADIRLREVAGDYDKDAFEFTEEEVGGEEDE
jgi:hypothetical protein